MPHPGRRVPQVMMLTMIIGLATAFPLFLSLMFYMKDFSAVISSRLPSLELINQVFVLLSRSTLATSTLMQSQDRQRQGHFVSVRLHPLRLSG